MRIEQLYYFLNIAEHKNISLVADKLLISQPRLSSNISSLEHELNAKLLYRTGHGVELTDIGKAIIPFAKSIVENSEEILHLTKNQNNSSQLSVSLNPIARHDFLKEILPRLNRDFQISNFQLIENYPKEVLTDIITCKANIGISAGTKLAIRNNEVIAANNNISFSLLSKTDTLCAICNINNHLAHEETISFQSLQNENFARFKGGHPKYSYYSTESTYENFSKLSFFENYESLFYSVSLQDMVAIVPLSLAKQNIYVQQQQVVIKPLCDYPINIQYYCLHNQNLTAIEKKCLELIVSLIK